MKTKVCEKSYQEVMALPLPAHKDPVRQSALFRCILSAASSAELKAVNFTYTSCGMEKLRADEPCLILMNHSSFTDLQIIARLFKDRPYNIVCTNDGFVGKEWLMRSLGCIPAKKFISDVTLIRDMKYCFQTLKSSVVMYPEASYSFDGTETPLPKSVGKFIKLSGVSVIMVKTEGSFLRDPLYNNLQKRKTDVSAKVSYLLSPQEIQEKSPEEINQILAEAFHYDHFRTQYSNHVKIIEPFRADGLHRVLYKCPRCRNEGKMYGEGTEIRCNACGASYELLENGKLHASDGNTEYEFIPDWYAWERQCVKEELLSGHYSMDLDVNILILADLKSIYRVGKGRLSHASDGFRLQLNDGGLDYYQPAASSYSLYADYYWYEIGDMISVGDTKYQYYCFPVDQKNAIVAKARLAAEEAYKLHNKKREGGK